MNRRVFLKSSGLALVAGGFVPRVFVRMASAETPRDGRVLVAIFLRGAVDGLNVVVPYGEDAYYAARPTIAIPRPGRGSQGALDLDGFFGLHPALAPIQALYRDGAAALVHAAGSPDPTRSHFDAQDFMESGTPGTRTTREGFLARALAASPRRGAPGVSAVRAAALTRAMPRILAGADGAVAVERLDRFGLRTPGGAGDDASTFETMYAAPGSGTLQASASESFEAVRALDASAPTRLAPANGAQYPPGALGRSLAQIAQLIRSGVGLEVAFADAGGWDTHAGQGGATGQLANRLRELGLAIGAFARDLGSRMSDVTLVTMSEFGRTVAENGNRGTDHGHGNAMILVGGGVRGGRVHARWPGLSGERLFERRDLGVTTDFRDVFAEVLTSRMGLTPAALDRVFPGYARTAAPGLVG